MRPPVCLTPVGALVVVGCARSLYTVAQGDALNDTYPRRTRVAEREREHETSRLKKYALIAAGSIFVVIGAIGVVLPVLPTTPFLLLAAACYIRSSQKFYDWLIGNRILGAYIKDYLSGEGLPVRAKVTTLSLLWLTIGATAIFAIDSTPIRILLLVVAIGVSTHILLIRTRR